MDQAPKRCRLTHATAYGETENPTIDFPDMLTPCSITCKFPAAQLSCKISAALSLHLPLKGIEHGLCIPETFPRASPS